MHATCSNCQSQFALDDRQVGPEGTAMRCSVCGYVFRVEPPAGSKSPAWKIRTVDEDEFSAPDLGTLRQWITEGRLHPDDRVSRTGRTWVRLGEMPEFGDLFVGFSDVPSLVTPVEAASGEKASAESSDVGPPPEFLGAEDSRAHMVAMETLPDDGSASIDLMGLVPAQSKRVILEPDESEELSLSDGSISELQDALAADENAPVRRVDEDAATVVARPSATRAASGVPTPAVRVPSSPPEPPPVRQTAPIVERVPRTGSPPPPPPRKRVASRPEPEPAAESEARPKSMLGAVTEMVKPITSRPIPVPDDLVDDEPVVSRRDPRSERSPSISPEDRARVTPDPDSEDSGPRGRVSVSEDSPAVAMPRRSTAWPIVATLGALCGAALVFGVPQIRQALFAAGDSGANDGVAPQPVAELDAARRALATAEPAALAEADAALSARLDQGVSDETAAWLRLAQAEVVATRAIWSRLLATVERDRADASRFEADDLAVRAAKLLVEAEASVLDPRAVARARARVKVAEGSPLASVLAGLRPDDAELELLVTATQLWREPQAPVPSGLVGGLMGLEEPSELARCVLAFAYLRSGDEAGARAIVDSLMLSASPPPVAIALSLRLDALEDPERAAEGAEPVAPEEPDSRSATDDERAKPDDGRAKPDDEDDHDEDESSGDDDAGPGRRDPDEAGSRSGGMSVSRMIDIGCERVDSGNAKEGLVLLEKALDQRFNDPDVSLCIGLGYLELGRPRTALVAYERALKQAPRLGGALRGAARAAKRSGQTDKAINYYRRVLQIEPRNAEARAFIDQHAGPSDDDGQ